VGVIKKHILEKENPNDEFAIVTKKLFTDNEHVKDSDLVLEFETSKANFEVYADAEGYIKYFFNVDDVVNFGDALLEIHDAELE
jgi:pyruvate/2-oxoglutarate dehydrogenase complex dihydrolipoamide acyltransferase (E2) component